MDAKSFLDAVSSVVGAPHIYSGLRLLLLCGILRPFDQWTNPLVFYRIHRVVNAYSNGLISSNFLEQYLDPNDGTVVLKILHRLAAIGNLDAGDNSSMLLPKPNLPITTKTSFADPLFLKQKVIFQFEALGHVRDNFLVRAIAARMGEKFVFEGLTLLLQASVINLFDQFSNDKTVRDKVLSCADTVAKNQSLPPPLMVGVTSFEDSQRIYAILDQVQISKHLLSETSDGCFVLSRQNSQNDNSMHDQQQPARPMSQQQQKIQQQHAVQQRPQHPQQNNKHEIEQEGQKQPQLGQPQQLQQEYNRAGTENSPIEIAGDDDDDDIPCVQLEPETTDGSRKHNNHSSEGAQEMKFKSSADLETNFTNQELLALPPDQRERVKFLYSCPYNTFHTVSCYNSNDKSWFLSTLQTALQRQPGNGAGIELQSTLRMLRKVAILHAFDQFDTNEFQNRIKLLAWACCRVQQTLPTSCYHQLSSQEQQVVWCILKEIAQNAKRIFGTRSSPPEQIKSKDCLQELCPSSLDPIYQQKARFLKYGPQYYPSSHHWLFDTVTGVLPRDDFYEGLVLLYLSGVLRPLDQWSSQPFKERFLWFAAKCLRNQLPVCFFSSMANSTEVNNLRKILVKGHKILMSYPLKKTRISHEKRVEELQRRQNRIQAKSQQRLQQQQQQQQQQQGQQQLQQRPQPQKQPPPQQQPPIQKQPEPSTKKLSQEPTLLSHRLHQTTDAGLKKVTKKSQFLFGSTRSGTETSEEMEGGRSLTWANFLGFEVLQCWTVE